jgi:hypothetical protein
MRAGFMGRVAVIEAALCLQTEEAKAANSAASRVEKNAHMHSRSL